MYKVDDLKINRLSCIFLLFLLAGIFLPVRFCFDQRGISLQETRAADTVWTGAVSTDWAVPGNWSLNAVPTLSDNVTIPDAATTANDPDISLGAVAANVIINASGVLNGNAQTISVYGGWTNNGTFNHGNGSVVFRGSGNVTFTPGSSEYYDLELDKISFDDLYISGTATVSRNFTQTDGELNSGQIDLSGDYIIGAAASGISPNSGAAYTTVNLSGIGDQSILYSAGGMGACVRIDKASGTVNVTSDIAVNGWVHIQGTVVGLDTYTLVFGDDQNGVFTPGTLTYGNMEINRSGSYDNLTVTATATVNGNLVHTNGDIRGGQIDLSGNYTIGASADGASGNSGWYSTVVNLSGTSDQSVVYSAGGIGVHMQVDKTGGNFIISSDIVICGWTYVQGTVAGLDTYKLIFGDDQHGTFTPGALVYHDLQMNKNSGYNELRVSGTATLTGDFIHTNGQLDAGQIDLLAGNYIIEATAEGLSSYSSTEICYVNFSGTGDQALVYSTGGVGTNVRVDKTSGTLTISSDIVVNGWTYVQGTVAGLNTYKLIFGGAQNSTFTPGSFVYNDIELYKPSSYDTLSILGTAIVAGDFIQTHGAMRLGQIDLTGDYIVGADASGTATYSSTVATIVNLNSSGDQAIIFSAGGIAAHIHIDKPSGTLTISSDITTCSWTYIRGTVVGMGTYKLTLGDDYHGYFAPGTLTYKDIEINKTGSYDDLTFSADTLNISGNLTFTDGEIKLNTNDPVVSVAGSVVIDVNALVYGSSNLFTVNGSWTNAGIFNHSNGTVVFGGTNTSTLTPGASAFYNLELNKTYDYGFYDNFVVSGTVEVANNLTHTDGEFRDGQINVAGNYIIGVKSGGAPSGSTPTIVNMNGAGDQQIIYNVGGVGDNIRIDKTSGTLTISSNVKVNGWNYVQGTVVGLDENVLIFGDDMLGYFVPGSLAYRYVEINKTSHNGIYDNVTVSGTVNLTGNLTHTEGEFNGGQFDISLGNYIVTATADGSQSGSASTIMNFNGAGDQSVVYSTGGVASHIRIDKPSGNLNIADGMIVHDWTYVRGNVPNIDSYTLVLGDNGQSYFTPGSLTYGNIEIYKTEHNGVYDDLYLTAGSLLTIEGNLYLREGQLRLDSNNPSITFGGDFTIGATSATFTKGTGTLSFTGTTPSIYTDLSATPQNIGKVVLNKSNADSAQNTLTLASGMTCDIMTVNSANTLDLGTGGHTLTLSNAGTTSNVLILNGTFDEGDGILKYAATNSAGNINIVDIAYNSLELSGAETYALTNNIDINGNLTIGVNSTLNTASYDIDLSGNLTNSGTFTTNTSAITLDGTGQFINGNTSFYDLTKTITSFDTLTFQASSTTTITHTLTFEGLDRDNRLSLHSSAPDTQWNLTLAEAATYDLDYLTVQDSASSRTLTVLNSLDEGNNTNWVIINNTAPSITTPTATTNGSLVTIITTVSDTDHDNISLKVEYSPDNGSIWYDPYLSSSTLSLNNSSEYQITGIATLSDSTITITWETKDTRNQSGAILYEDDLKIRITPYDNTDIGTARTSISFTINNRSAVFIAPTKPIVTLDDIISGNLPDTITQIAISTTPDFSESSWQLLDREKLKTITTTDQVLYLKFRTLSGAVSDTVIIYPSTSLQEGDIVKTASSFDVYIIKYKNNKQFKRLILSPSVFNSYGHLRWKNIKTISEEQLNGYLTSNLVKVKGDSYLYELTPFGDTGERRVVDISSVYDIDSVYEINVVDRDSYRLEN